jgi:PEP-CTERM/exosortase A-associated glycosyltransferase
MSERLKILHVFDHSAPLHSGYTFRSLNIINEQRRLGWDTCHVTGVKHARETQAQSVEEVENLRFYRTGKLSERVESVPVLNQVAGVRKLAQRIREVIALEEPDIVHAHSPALNGLAALNATRAAGCPLVYEIRAFWEDAAVDHGTTQENSVRYRLGRALETYVVRRADAITTICEGLRNELMATRGVPAAELTVIPNAVDAAHFAANSDSGWRRRRELGLEDRFVLGFIGSFYAYEGLRLLVEATARLADEMPEIHLVLVGGGPEDDRLHALVRDLDAGSRVTFTGRVPHDDVAGYYQMIDVLVYPRLPMRLTDLVTPLKPLETMAQGGVVVASDVGGHKELIDNGRTGILFRAGDVDDLVGVLRDLRSDPVRCEAIRRAGPEFVRRHRTWEASVARYRGVYSRVLGRDL